MDNSATTAAEQVARVVTGGATAFPTYDGPIPPPNRNKYMLEYLKSCVRGPALCVLVTHLVYSTYTRLVKSLLAKGLDEERAFTVLATCVHVGLYFGMAAFFETLEYFKLLRHYKLARTAGQEPTWAMKSKTLIEFTASQLLNILATGPVLFRGIMRSWGGASMLDPLPSNWRMYKTFVVAHIVNRVGFAVAHQVCHHGPLYRAIHKKHHEYVGTVSLATENAHPVEQIVANLLPTLGGCLLVGSHPLVFLVWLAWRLEETYEAHSGYCFAGSWLHRIGLTNSDLTAYHDHHHVVNKGNFGDALSDYLMDTNQHWRATGENEGYIARSREVRAKEGY